MSTCTALIPVERSTTEELLQNPEQLLRQLFQTRRQANYWKAQFQRSKEREAKLQEEIRTFRAKIRQLEHELFGRTDLPTDLPINAARDFCCNPFQLREFSSWKLGIN